jgi:hypothetical protein
MYSYSWRQTAVRENTYTKYSTYEVEIRPDRPWVRTVTLPIIGIVILHGIISFTLALSGVGRFSKMTQKN